MYLIGVNIYSINVTPQKISVFYTYLVYTYSGMSLFEWSVIDKNEVGGVG